MPWLTQLEVLLLNAEGSRFRRRRQSSAGSDMTYTQKEMKTLLHRKQGGKVRKGDPVGSNVCCTFEGFVSMVQVIIKPHTLTDDELINAFKLFGPGLT